MMVGGRQRSQERMEDRVWYQATTFRTANLLLVMK